MKTPVEPNTISWRRLALVVLGAGGFGGVAGAIGNVWFLTSTPPSAELAVPAPPTTTEVKASATHTVNRPFTAVEPRPSWEELLAAPLEDRLRLLTRWLPAATAEEVAELVQRWLPNYSSQEPGIVAALVRRWVEVDPEAALVWGRAEATRLRQLLPVAQIQRDVNELTPLRRVYLALGQANPSLALERLFEEPPGFFHVLQRIIWDVARPEDVQAWARRHPERGVLASQLMQQAERVLIRRGEPAEAAERVSEKTDVRALSGVATRYAEVDPEAALTWARALPSGRQRAHALRSVAEVLLKTDPEQARAVIDTLPPNPSRWRLEATYAGELAKSNPDAAQAFAREKLHGMAQLQAIVNIAAQWAQKEPLRGLQLWQEYSLTSLAYYWGDEVNPLLAGAGAMGLMPSPAELSAILTSAATVAPEQVMEMLKQDGIAGEAAFWESRRAVSLGARQVMKDWISVDPSAAGRWLSQLSVGEVLQPMVKQAAEAWFSQDEAGLRDHVARLPAGETQLAWVRETAELMVSREPQETLTWAQAMAGEAGLGTAYQALARVDPVSAAEAFPLLPPTQQQVQFQVVMERLGGREPAAAARFYAQLPEAWQGEAQLGQTVWSYLTRDPQAASEWVVTLPESAAKDSAISSLVHYLIHRAAEPDLETAAQWAIASHALEAQEQNLQRVAQAWFERSPDEARSQIEVSALPPRTKERLLHYGSSR